MSVHDTATKFVNQCVTAAGRIREPMEPQWEENWANYRVEPYFGSSGNDFAKMDPYGSRKPSGINSLKTPESHQVTNTLTSVLLASLFGVRDYIQASAVGDEDWQAARKVSKLVMFGLERPGNYRTVYETLKDGIIFGSGFYKAIWKTTTRTVARRRPAIDPTTGQMVVNPENGMPISVMQMMPAAVYDDVSLVPMSPYDLWLDPAATRLQDCDWGIERFRISRDDLIAKMGQPGWLDEGLAKVLAGKADEWAVTTRGTSDSPKLKLEHLTREDVKHVTEYGYYGGFQFTGMLPSQIAAELGLDPTMSNTFAIINGWLVHAAPNPEYRAQLPYGSISILPTGGQIYGLSPLTVVRYLQDVSDTQLILNTQAAIEAAYQNYLVGGPASMGPDFSRQLMNRRPREVFNVPGDITQIIPLPKDYAGLQIAMSNLAAISASMRDASSARDPVQGIMSNDRSTATEVQTVSSAALQNVDQLAALIERDELPRMGDLVFGLYYMNLEDEGRVLQRVGDREAQKIGFYDIDGTFDITFVGARQALSKGQRANAFKELVTAASMNPMFAAQFNFDEYVLRIADEVLDIRGAQDLIQTDPNEVLARMQLMNMNGQGQPAPVPGSKQAVGAKK